MHDIECQILAGLVNSEEFSRKVLPHVVSDHFSSDKYKIVYDLIHDYESEHNKVPPKQALLIDLDSKSNLSETLYQEIQTLITRIFSEEYVESTQKVSQKWLTERTEQHCKDRSVYNAIMKSIAIINGEEKKLNKEAIPDILQKALAICFDTSVGHDYLEDVDRRYDLYHKEEKKISFPLSMMNTITKGGLPSKTLGVIIAPTGVGKTTVKTFFSSHFLMEGKNVLYITLEMAEERIAERIDSALMDISMDKVKMLTREKLSNKVGKLKSKTIGKLIIKEYPPGSVSVNTMRALLEELKMKKDFVPEVIVVDYLNLLKSSRLKNSENSYQYIKSIAEELRGLAVEQNVLCLTSSQTNRSAQGSSDWDLQEVSESHGLSATSDFMIGIISTEEMEELNQIRIKQLKNRFGPLQPKSFVCGIDREKMKLYDIDTISNPDASYPSYKKSSENLVDDDDSNSLLKPPSKIFSVEGFTI